MRTFLRDRAPTLSEGALAILIVLCGPDVDEDSISAERWTEEIHELLVFGYAELQGTLTAAELVPTQRGIALAEATAEIEARA